MRARTHANPFSFREALAPIDLSTAFESPSPVVDLEIGTGTGLFLRHYASRFPDRNIIGVEVRKKMADLVADRVASDGLKNAKMVYGTAEKLLDEALIGQVIDRVFVFHPDPWFKKRHHNRRVIRRQFLDQLSAKMVGGGQLYISTDVTELWEAMVDTLSEASWVPVQDPDFWDTLYTTHWKLYTESDARPQHTGIWRIPGTLNH